MINPNLIAFTASEISAYMRKDRDRPASNHGRVGRCYGYLTVEPLDSYYYYFCSMPGYLTIVYFSIITENVTSILNCTSWVP